MATLPWPPRCTGMHRDWKERCVLTAGHAGHCDAGGVSAGRHFWSPHLSPWRVTWTFRTSAPGMHGWGKTSEVFATEYEANGAMNLPFPRGTWRAEIDLYVDGEFRPRAVRVLPKKK